MYTLNDKITDPSCNNIFVNASALGSTVIVPAVTGKRIKVVGAIAVSALANTVNFLSATTAITAGFPLGANGGFILPYNPAGWFQTAVGEALNINMTAAAATGINIAYEEV